MKNLKMSEDDVHKEAAAYFNIPDLKSLDDIPGLTARRWANSYSISESWSTVETLRS